MELHVALRLDALDLRLAQGWPPRAPSGFCRHYALSARMPWSTPCGRAMASGQNSRRNAPLREHPRFDAMANGVDRGSSGQDRTTDLSFP